LPLDHVEPGFTSSAVPKQGRREKKENLFSQMQLKPMGPEQLFDSLLTATGALKSTTGERT